MAKNCELYNGTQHFYSKDARQIYNETLDLINVDREILGRDKDPYAIQQNDIRAKSAPLPPLSPSSSFTIPLSQIPSIEATSALNNHHSQPHDDVIPKSEFFNNSYFHF